MKKGVIIGAVVLVALAVVVGIVISNKDKDKAASSSSTPSTSNQKSGTSSSGSNQSTASTDNSASAAPATSFTIKANDDTADVKTINVKKGDTISVTFAVSNDEVYHGGLEFKSDMVNSKPIQPGSSDTVTFTADKSFKFQPYWYQSDVEKDYQIAVNVQG